MWTKLAFLKTCGGLNCAGCEFLEEEAALAERALEATTSNADAIDNGFIVTNEWKGHSLSCACARLCCCEGPRMMSPGFLRDTLTQAPFQTAYVS